MQICVETIYIHVHIKFNLRKFAFFLKKLSNTMNSPLPLLAKYTLHTALSAVCAILHSSIYK